MNINELLDILWIAVGAMLVFLMQAGFAMVESGLTRSKNSINVAIKNLTDLGVSLLCFWIFGFAIMFGTSFKGIIGTTHFLLSGTTAWSAVFFFFQSTFCSTSATIVSGAVAERMKFSSYIVATILLSALIYPVFGHWAWGGLFEGGTTGWLASLGFVDFAGSTVVHSVGGWIALAALLIIGPRTGRFDGKNKEIPGSNIPITVLGVILLWFGWFGFNGGSTLSWNETVPGIILRTTLAAGAGMVFTLAFGWFRSKRPDISYVLNGALAGLVAITANCHAVSEAESVLIGGIGGLVMLAASGLLRKLKIDDAVDAIPVHLAAGIWGTLAVGIFGDTEILGTGLSPLGQMGIQLLGIAVCGIWTFSVAFIILFLINKGSSLRVSAEDEQAGLNVAEHGVSTEIHDFFTILETQATTGDLSLRAPVEPFTEVGQIASRYNSVLNKLEESTIAKSEYVNILDNVSDGLFLIDSEGSIGAYYSAETERIFKTDKLFIRNFHNLIRQLLTEEDYTEVREYIEMLFDPKMNKRGLDKLNPLSEKEFFYDDKRGGFESIFLDFHFKRIEKEGEIVRLMVIVRDITRRLEMARNIEEQEKQNQSEMKLFYQILHIEPQVLAEFLHSAQTEMAQFYAKLENDKMMPEERLHGLFRNAHAIKGDAGILNLDFLSDQTHKLEDSISHLLSLNIVENSDFLSLTMQAGEIEKSISRLNELLKKMTGFQKSFVAANLGSKEDYLVSSLDKMVQRISSRKGKLIEFNPGNFSSRNIPMIIRKNVKDILVQLIRNSVAHGIETPDERLARGKKATGLLALTSLHSNNNLTLTFRDDGNGIDKEKIRMKLREQKGLSESEAAALSENELIKAIFQPGLSTAEKVNKDAGRGIGMDVVRNIVKQSGGKLNIKSKKGEFSEFSITLPCPG